MAIKQESHIIKGIQRDLTKSKFSPEYAFDAYNIRITAREDTTLMSVTNEKGNKEIPLFSNGESATISGSIIGHNVLNDYITLFTTGDSDRIYRLEKKDEYFELLKIYEGSLGFSKDHPIETLGVFENDNILKVYWTDGLNQPRVINIVKEKLIGMTPSYNSTSFDFVLELNLEETVTVERLILGNGSFAPGVIQYAFTYYNKYGQESSIFDISELMYISHPNRGASPEDKVNNSFSITITNADTKFDYLRIYSIQRTSINATPSVKKVVDLPVESEITYIDNGSIGEYVDPTQLLYVGGESIVANTITQKDNTLFLGNIRITRPSIPDTIKTSIKEYMEDQISTELRTIEMELEGKEGYYINSSQLAKGNTSYFKPGEHYRLGVLFQYKTGRWSEPIFIKDFTVPINNRPSLGSSEDGESYILRVPVIKGLLDDGNRLLLTNIGYRKYRGVVTYPELLDRLIITLGMLCPTVFMAGNRRNNTPFSLSSWFIRPNLPKDVAINFSSDQINNSMHIDRGAWVEFRHLQALKSKYDRGAEIQNMSGSPLFSSVNNSMLNNSDDYSNIFMVDLSIVTMHSPDIEFDTTFSALDGADLKLRIVGLINFTASVGDIDIQTSTPAIHSESSGFIHKSLGTVNRNPLAARSLVSGLFYKDYLVDETGDAEKYEPYTYQTYEYSYLIYPWHRSGSLNNDINRPEGKGARSAVLLKKVISNMKFSEYNTWLSSPWNADTLARGITDVQLFNSDEISLIKIPVPENSYTTSMNYYGNVDTLIPSQDEYGIAFSLGNKKSTFYDTGITDTNSYAINTNDDVGDYDGKLKKTKDPVRMKYKSTPHFVFSFNSNVNGQQHILPNVNLLNNCTIRTQPFWIKNATIASDTRTYQPVKYKEVFPPNMIYSDLTPGNLWIGPGGNTIDTAISLFRFVLWLYTGTSEVVEEWGISGWRKVDLSTATTGYVFTGEDRNYYYVPTRDDHGWYLEEVDQFEDPEYETLLDIINIPSADVVYPFLYLAELYKDASEVTNAFGGDNTDDNLWLPAGKSVSLNTGNILYQYGDTWYQRYDCLKTYPFTREDENQIVEIASFMCETRVNIDGRYDRNRGQASNLNMSPINFNLYNPVYSQKDNFFNYRILDSDLYSLDKFSNSITWTKEKSLAEIVDTWTNITMASTLDLDGDKGAITSLNTFNNEIFCFQLRGLSNILFNSRVQIPTSDGVPIEITNGLKVLGKRYISNSVGCNNKWSITESPMGLYFIDDETSAIYLFNGQINTLSGNLGFSQWVRENSNSSIWNPQQFGNFISYYDKSNGDIYFTNKDTCLCYSERVGQFTSFMSYENIYPMFNVGNALYSFDSNSNLWEHFAGDYNMFYGNYKPYSFTIIANADMPYDKIFNNIEFRSDCWAGNTLVSDRTFDTLEVWNEYLKGITTLINTIDKPSSLKKKFRIWRANIPRFNTDHNGVTANNRDRIRNTWAYIKLSMNTPNTWKTEFHDLMVHYFI